MQSFFQGKIYFKAPASLPNNPCETSIVVSKNLPKATLQLKRNAANAASVSATSSDSSSQSPTVRRTRAPCPSHLQRDRAGDKLAKNNTPHLITSNVPPNGTYLACTGARAAVSVSVAAAAVGVAACRPGAQSGPCAIVRTLGRAVTAHTVAYCGHAGNCAAPDGPAVGCQRSSATFPPRLPSPSWRLEGRVQPRLD